MRVDLGLIVNDNAAGRERVQYGMSADIAVVHMGGSTMSDLTREDLRAELEALRREVAAMRDGLSAIH
jgi:hypothetical protein